MVAEFVHGGVGEDDWCSGDNQRVYHCLVGHVTQIYHHAQTIHLFHDYL